VEDRSVRPDHRMVGHTGFLTTARLLRPEELGSRPGGSVGWTPPAAPTAAAPPPVTGDDGAPGTGEGDDGRPDDGPRDGIDGVAAADPVEERWPRGDGLG